MASFCIKCHYAECRNLFIIMLNVIMLSIIMPNVVLLNVVAPFLSIDDWFKISDVIVRRLYSPFFSLCQWQNGQWAAKLNIDVASVC